jgi:hypothetical protein
MPRSRLRASLLGAVVFAVAGPAIAQSTSGAATVSPAPNSANATPHARPVSPSVAGPAGTMATPAPTSQTTAAAPSAGANSFTEGQARTRIEAAGFTNVTGLSKDAEGIWRGKASRAGTSADVALDFHGVVVSGAAARARHTTASTVAPASGTVRDGTAANPPSTAVGRAADRAQGETPRADGAPGNPPGTAAGRAVDRAVGTNMSGANPGANRADGAPGNPPSTAVGRAVDRAQGETPRADGSPGNPPGTSVGRAVGTSPAR